MGPNPEIQLCTIYGEQKYYFRVVHFCQMHGLLQVDISQAIAGRRCSLVLTADQETQMLELISKMLK